MIAIIAEKPSVAREIANIIGATEKREGFLTGNGYHVTWALGHLVGLAMPEDYGITGFQREALPIMPDPFLLTVRKIKKEKTFVPDIGAVKQLKIIEHVIGNSDSIIVATDAGREGELIFRYIYQYLKCNKPFQRLWISSLTEKAIKQGFDNLKPGSDFDGLYHAGQGRSQADWLVGINASQALSIVAGGVYSLGRVQTPTLSLICKRYLENRNFVIKKFWQLQLEHRKEFVTFKSLSTTKWDEKKIAEDTFKIIERAGSATVKAVETRTITEHPPLLFDLTGLQKEANKKLGLSAEETLNVAQSLYEKQFITYPRTGSKYIPKDMWSEIPGLVRVLDARASCKESAGKLRWGSFNKRIVNDLKVTDHHGLLITEKMPSALTAKEIAIYDMIAMRLLEALSQSCSKQITDITLNVLQFEFLLKGSRLLTPGWRGIQGSFTEDDSDPIQELPELTTGDELKIKSADILEKKTKPPLLFTEADLLAAMESAGRHMTNEDERKALQGIGIGTPATRASIIEILFKREYIRREKKYLIPTEKGLQVYEIVKDKRIADVAMTADWEVTLQKIENNEADAVGFHQSMEKYTASIAQELLSIKLASEIQPELSCPKCNAQRLLIRDKIVKCPEETCNWLQFRNVCGMQLSISEIENLLNKGKTSLIKGFKSKAGKKFDAYIILKENGESSFEFENAPRKKT